MVVVVETFNHVIWDVVAIIVEQIFISVHDELLEDASIGVGQLVESPARLVAKGLRLMRHSAYKSLSLADVQLYKRLPGREQLVRHGGEILFVRSNTT